jgi:hypothetical protein
MKLGPPEITKHFLLLHSIPEESNRKELTIHNYIKRYFIPLTRQASPQNGGGIAPLFCLKSSLEGWMGGEGFNGHAPAAFPRGNISTVTKVQGAW